MSFWEEALCCVVLFFFPGAALWVPVVMLGLALAGPWLGWTPLLVAAGVCAATCAVPAPFSPSIIHSRVSVMLLK